MRAERLLSIILLLQVKGRMTAEDLATELGVSARTIYRDLEALSMAGVALYGDRGPGGGYALMDGYRTSLTGLTQSEASSLFVSALPRPLADLGLDKTLRDAMLKLLAALPAGRREEVEQEMALIHLDAAPWFYTTEPVPHLPLLRQAARQRRKVHIRYQYPDGYQSERWIAPYGLVAKASLWYVVADTPNGMRNYRVSRIQQAEMLPDTFERPRNFNLEQHWNETCEAFEKSLPHYPVTLRVAPDMTGALMRVYGESIRSRIEAAEPPDAEGRIILPFVYETREMACGAVLALGAGVEVMDPPELRDLVAETARQIVAQYANDEPVPALPVLDSR